MSILADLSDYLRKNGRASLSDMAIAMESTPKALEGMLATLEHKGRIKRLPTPSMCNEKSCCCSVRESAQMYAWVGDDDSNARPVH